MPLSFRAGRHREFADFQQSKVVKLRLWALLRGYYSRLSRLGDMVTWLQFAEKHGLPTTSEVETSNSPRPEHHEENEITPRASTSPQIATAAGPLTCKRKRDLDYIPTSLAVPTQPAPISCDTSKDHAAVAQLPAANPVAAAVEKIEARKNSVTFRQHDIFYFSDLFVFVQLDGIRFKLHHSRLDRVSLFFSDLFKKRGSRWEWEWMNIPIDTGDSVTVSVRVEDHSGFSVYILDNIGLRLQDFEVILKIMDNGVAYGGKPVPMYILASAIRGATTLCCPEILSWAVRGTEQIWTSHTFLKPIPDALECFIVARKYNLPHKITTRALYEVLRPKELDHTQHLSMPRKELDLARTKLYEEWIFLAAKPENSFVTCPLSGHDDGRCISQSADSVQDIHSRLVHTSCVLDTHLFDPIGGLEHLISMDELWAAEGYCFSCIELRKRKWTKKKDILIGELQNLFKGIIETG
ncbi:hypothetical protein C8R43DRAFT_1151198 [Mycena crocata]|nr:hypothetical protein C8R43DRAFT_1151198 [Mycena crocata]